MTMKPKKTQAGTNIEEVKKQNKLAAGKTYETEFASETNAEDVKEQLKKSKQNKK